MELWELLGMGCSWGGWVELMGVEHQQVIKELVMASKPGGEQQG